MNSDFESFLRQTVEAHNREVTHGLNEQLGLPSAYDQSHGNRCDLLTSYVLSRLDSDQLVARRELHIDDKANWHFLIAHTDIVAVPSETDIISDLNPWQWRDYGGGILHGPRHEVMSKLRDAGASERFIALRGLSTLRSSHHQLLSPFNKK